MCIRDSFYRVPAMLGMQTGLPLYVVGSSTFGTKGGYLMPGLLMGVLQVGWISVNAFVSATFVLSAFGSNAGPGSVPFSIVAGVWALAMGYIGVKGIQYVSKFSTFLNWVPLLLIIVVFFNNVSGVSRYTPVSYTHLDVYKRQGDFVFLVMPLKSQHQDAQGLQSETPHHAKCVGLAEQHHITAAQNDGKDLHDGDGVDNAVGGAVFLMRLAGFLKQYAVFRYPVHDAIRANQRSVHRPRQNQNRCV